MKRGRDKLVQHVKGMFEESHFAFFKREGQE